MIDSIPNTKAEINSGPCYWHRQKMTRLRCSECNRSICPACAKRTRVGYKCQLCIHELQSRFFNGRWWDYGVAIVVALPVLVAASLIFAFYVSGIPYISWIVAFFLAQFVAQFVAEIVFRAVHRRRSRYLAHVAASCVMMATVPTILFILLTARLSGAWDFAYYTAVEPSILMVVGIKTIMMRM